MEKSCSVIDWSRMHLTRRIRMRIHTLLTGVSIGGGLSVGRKLYKKIRSTPEKLVETVALRQGFIALESPAYLKKAATDIAAALSSVVRGGMFHVEHQKRKSENEKHKAEKEKIVEI